MPRRSEKETPKLTNYNVQSEEAGQFLARRRMALGLSVRELSDRAGVAPGTVAKLEKGEFTVQLDKFLVILDQLDLPFDSLFGYKGERTDVPTDPVAAGLTKLLRAEEFEQILRLLADEMAKRERRGPKE